MTGANAESNLQTYDKAEVAAHYALLNYLTPCELLLFETYVKPGSAILDLGVGGGRTTPFLSKRSSSYVGADYAPAMIRACQSRFPGVAFKVADASDLSAFSSSSFDAVVFAFNGIDYVLPDQARSSCLRHVVRVLKPGGVVIFSSHNACAVVVRPRWNRARVRRLAEKWSGESRTVSRPLLTMLLPARVAIAFLQAAWGSFPRLIKRIPSRVFWRGEGNLVDSAHGGLLTHYSTPASVIHELTALDLLLARILGDEYPQPSHPYSTDWYYYVFTKPGPDKSGK